MSFQAYLDNIEEKTGKAPEEFVAEAKKEEPDRIQGYHCLVEE